MLQFESGTEASGRALALASPAARTGEIDRSAEIGDLWRILWRQRASILWVTLALVAATSAFCLLTPPLYTATAQILQIALRSGTGLAALAMAPTALVALAVGGLFDRLAERFVSDGGSANARLEMLALIDRIPLRELMFGPDPAFAEIGRRCRPGTLLPVLGFALLVNASESLASKTTLLAKFALTMLALYRPINPPRGR